MFSLGKEPWVTLQVQRACFGRNRPGSLTTSYRGVAQLVARLLWEQDVGSSSLPSRTSKSRLFLQKQPAFATFYHIYPQPLPPQRINKLPRLSQSGRLLFNVERTALPCAHAPERYNKNSYNLRLKPTGGCLFLCREILNRNLFIRYAINKLQLVQNRKHIVTCHMASLSQK